MLHFQGLINFFHFFSVIAYFFNLYSMISFIYWLHNQMMGVIICYLYIALLLTYNKDTSVMYNAAEKAVSLNIDGRSFHNLSLSLGLHPCTPRHTWSPEWGEYGLKPAAHYKLIRISHFHLLSVRWQKGDSPGSLFQETHTVWEPDRLQDI